MIKVAMVHLDGTEGDELRMAAAESLVALFGAHVIALLLNPLPKIIPSSGGAAAQLWTQLTELAHEAGNRAEAALVRRLSRLATSSEIRRFDAFADEIGVIAAREARAADVFVALRPGGEAVPATTDDIIEGVLFGAGRHLLLVADAKPFAGGFAHILLAWNGSREAARAMAEAMPYLAKCRLVTVLVAIEHDAALPSESTSGEAALNYLRQHGISAKLHVVECGGRDIASTLVEEADHRKADLIVMGAYGHSRLRERIFGGVTYHLLRGSPVSLIIAH